MIPSRYQDYVDKIIFLEKRFGKRLGYKNLNPFSVDADDIVDIQKAARRIADFIGLDKFTFNVSINSKMEEAGRIELKPGKDAFVELSERHLVNEETVLAILAHEITHKYLTENGIHSRGSFAEKYDNEILTDITAVFLGLGKLILNGCEYTTFHNTPTTTRTTEHKVGYLNKHEIAFAYCLVCNMRGVDKLKFKNGLTRSSKGDVENCLSSYSRIFNDKFHNLNIEDELIGKFKKRTKETQKYLLDIDKKLRYIKQASVDVTESFLQNAHKRIKKSQEEIKNSNEKVENDPCLRFLNALKLSHKIDKKNTTLNKIEGNSLKYKDNLNKLSSKVNNLGKPFLAPTSKMFEDTVCRIDDVTFKINNNQQEAVTKCPECEYQFLSNVLVPKIEDRDKNIDNRRFDFLVEKFKKIKNWLKFTPFLFIFLRSIAGHQNTFFIIFEFLIFINIIYLVWRANNIGGKLLKSFSVFLALLSILFLFMENVSGFIYGAIALVLIFFIKTENNK